MSGEAVVLIFLLGLFFGIWLDHHWFYSSMMNLTNLIDDSRVSCTSMLELMDQAVAAKQKYEALIEEHERC